MKKKLYQGIQLAMKIIFTTLDLKISTDEIFFSIIAMEIRKL